MKTTMSGAFKVTKNTTQARADRAAAQFDPALDGHRIAHVRGGWAVVHGLRVVVEAGTASWTAEVETGRARNHHLVLDGAPAATPDEIGRAVRAQIALTPA